MKRTRLARRTGLKGGRVPAKRDARLRARGRSRFPKRRCPDYVAWIATLPCLLGNQACFGSVVAAHVKTRGAGGDDVGNALPLCRDHHDEQHRIGIQTFQARYGLDLAAEAKRLGDLWRGSR